MNAHWRDFLTARGARAADGDLLEWPEAAEADGGAEGCRLFDLSHLGLIAVRGADAFTFLQGQLTNDVRELSEAHTQLAGYCSPKGRMLGCFRVMRYRDGNGEAILLQCPRERLPELLKRLKMFVLRAQVGLEDASDALVRIGVTGECVPALLAAAGLPWPARDADIARATGGSFDGVAVLRLPGPVPRCELIAPPERAESLWDTLAQGASPAGADAWALHDIRAGLPSVYDATADAFVPQMANLQLIDGVSFHKGCYTGQEVVARMQYLGRLKRRMYLGELESDTAPRPGDELFDPASTSGQGTGRIVDARPAAPGRYELLAVVEIAAAEHAGVHLGPGGPPVRLRPPPYGFPEAAEAAASAQEN